MNNLIPLTETNEGTQAVMGRDLHEFIESGEQYTTWFKRMISYAFTEGVDYVHKNKKIERPAPLPPAVRTNHIISLDMAKEISMIQRNDKGKQARQYFLEVERRYKTQAPQELTRKQILTMALEAEERPHRECSHSTSELAEILMKEDM